MSEADREVASPQKGTNMSLTSTTTSNLITSQIVYYTAPTYNADNGLLQTTTRNLTVSAAWTNLGPLTTTFQPPASCSPNPPGGLYAYVQDEYDNPSDEAWGSCEIYNLIAPKWLDCQPSGSAYSSLWWGTSSTYTPSYYSPGIHCPSGYTSADVFVLDSSNVSTASVQADALRTTGTHVFCCPR